MIYRAFLSYSSKDKALVELVARELDTDRVIYDSYSFDTGIQFRDSIEHGLDQSSVFVLFASTNSINSDWVRYESNEANSRYLAGRIVRPLVFLIDDSLEIDDLPRWLSEDRKASRERSPRLIALQIRRHLDEITVGDQQVGFVGRGADLDRTKALMRPLGESSRRAVFLFGIHGIGKRTFIGRVFNDVYQLSRVVGIRVAVGDDFLAVTLKLADRAGIYTGPKGLPELVDDIRRVDEKELRMLASDYVRRIISNKALPLFIDEGGLVDNDGRATSVVAELLALIEADSNIKMGFTTFRRLQDGSFPGEPASVQVQLNEMLRSEIQQLIAAFLDRHEMSLTKAQFERAADWTRGHPWSAKYAAELVAAYGFEHVDQVASVSSLRATLFITELDARGSLSRIQRNILRVLADYAPLPAGVLIDYCATLPVTFYNELAQLVDRALVLIENNAYRLADPIVEAVLQRLNRTNVDHFLVHKALRTAYTRATLGDEILETQVMELGRLAWLAATAANLPISSEYVHLASDAIRSARKAFYEKRYEDSLRLGRYALAMNNDDPQVRSIVGRSLARLDHFSEALDEAQEMKNRGQLRDSLYLQGYIAQLQGKHEVAIGTFKEAIRHGRMDSSVFRGLAESLLYTDQLNDAKHFAERALSRDDNQRFVLDLLVRIAVKRGDLEDAAMRLRQLAQFENSPYFNHRRSTVLFAEGNLEAAAAEARIAYKAIKNTPEVAVQFIRATTAVGDTESAWDALKKLKGEKRENRRDLTIGLEVQLLSAMGNFEEALLVWDRLEQKTRPVNLAIRHEALAGYITTLANTDPLRAAMQQELAQLDRDLNGQQTKQVLARA